MKKKFITARLKDGRMKDLEDLYNNYGVGTSWLVITSLIHYLQKRMGVELNLPKKCSKTPIVSVALPPDVKHAVDLYLCKCESVEQENQTTLIEKALEEYIRERQNN
jgi:hypothetical protein